MGITERERNIKELRVRVTDPKEGRSESRWYGKG